MAQDHGHLRTSDGASTFTSARSDYGTGSGFDREQHHPVSSSVASSFGGGGYPVPAHGGVPSLGAGQPRVALPASVKLPPSMMMSTYQTQPRLSQQPMMAAMPNSHTVTYHPPVSTAPSTSGSSFSHGPHPVQEFGAADVIRQLDLAADENNRLRGRLKENNTILEKKVQEIQRCLQSRDRNKETISRLQTQLEQAQREAAERREEAQQRKSMPARMSDTSAVDETTNKLFEAQVAVMGFKCRVMQLQGELDDRQREGWADTAGREEIEHLRTENTTLRDDLKVVKEERDVAQKQKPSSNARIERELKLKIQELSNMVLSQELIIREVNQQLTDKRHLHETETQRMGSLSQQQQTQISSLQAELGRLQSHLTGQQQSSQQQAEIESLRSELSRAQNQLATQQQSYELRLTSLTTQSNMARQEQARAQEMGKQLTVAHAEISKLNQDLRDAQKEAEKYRKKSEISETKVKDSTSKMMSMEDQLKSKKMSGPVPRPRGDIAQLKSEIEALQMEVATIRSNYERERRAREGVETELQVERRKIQELLMKNTQLQAQLGTGGGGGREQEVEVERLKRENSRSEASLAELEKEKKELLDSKIETEAKLAQVQEELATARGPQTGPGKPRKTLEVRLNDYAGKLATLEGLFDNEKKENTKFQNALSQEKQRTEELERRVQELAREKSHVEDETLRNLQQQKSEVERRLHDKEREQMEAIVRHQEELDRLRAETALQKQNYERKIDEKEGALRVKERELETVLQSGASEREGEVVDLRTELRRAQSQLQQKDGEIAHARTELQSHKTQLHTLSTEKENLRANEGQISARLRDTLHENDRLKNELTKTQKVTGEFRKECESLVGDYQTAAKKIEQVEKERDRFRDQADMGMRELASRAERIKALEAERQGLQDQLHHMDMQLKQYMADFRSEREMRESAFQVKEMAERRQHELSGEVSTLQKQLTELQTVKHFDTDVSDDPAAAGGGRGGGRQWSGGRVMPTPRPPPTDPSSSPQAAPPLPPKPGGEYNFPPRQHNIQQHPPQQQYVGAGGGAQGLPPHHHRQELVASSATPFPQTRPPPVSQPLVAVPTGMSPRQHSGGSPYPPNSRVDPVIMDPHRPPVGGGPPEQRFVQVHPFSAAQIGPPHGAGGVRPAPPVSVVSPPRPAHTSDGQNWVAPGDFVNTSAPEVACPLCGRNDFATVTDLEIHCARCTGPP